MVQRLRRFGIVLEILGMCSLMAFSVVLVSTFYTAFFSGYRVTIYINHFGEAWVEAFLIPILFISGIVCFFRVLIKSFKESIGKGRKG